jgi:hypothetical protein
MLQILPVKINIVFCGSKRWIYFIPFDSFLVNCYSFAKLIWENNAYSMLKMQG